MVWVLVWSLPSWVAGYSYFFFKCWLHESYVDHSNSSPTPCRLNTKVPASCFEDGCIDVVSTIPLAVLKIYIFFIYIIYFYYFKTVFLIIFLFYFIFLLYIIYIFLLFLYILFARCTKSDTMGHPHNDSVLWTDCCDLKGFVAVFGLQLPTIINWWWLHRSNLKRFFSNPCNKARNNNVLVFADKQSEMWECITF